MKLSDLMIGHELLEEQLASDPAFRAEWERTALARGIAVAPGAPSWSSPPHEGAPSARYFGGMRR